MNRLRVFALFGAVLLAFSASASGIEAAIRAISAEQKWMVAPEFSDRQMPAWEGMSPGKDPVYRAGLWTRQTLRDLGNSRFGRCGEFGTLGKGRSGSMAVESDWTHATFAEFATSFMKGRSYTGPEPAPSPFRAAWTSSSPLFLLQGGGGGEGGGDAGGGEGGGLGGSGGGPSTGGGSGGGNFATGSGGGGGGATVNTHTGNRLHPLPLVGWPARGQLAVDFTLFHNSQTEYNRELGFGWSWTFGVSIAYTQGSSAIVRWGDGTMEPFTEDQGQFTPPPGFHDTLVRNQNGTWTLTTKSQIVFSFNSDGFLRCVADRNGDQITLALNQDNLVTEIEDPSGRALTIRYDQNDRIESVTDPLNRTWTFTYSGGELVEVSLPEIDGQVHPYEFTYNSSHDMTSVTDLRGKVWTMEYDGGERLTAWEDPVGNRYQYTYGSTYTDIRNPLNKTVRHNYSSGMLASTVDEANFSDAYVWDSDKNLVQYTDRRGKVWEFDYDSNGNLLWAENPLNKRATFTYNRTNDLLTAEDAMENVWQFSYDQNGNLESVVNPLEIEIVTCDYDGDGQLTSVTIAWNDTNPSSGHRHAAKQRQPTPLSTLDTRHSIPSKL